MRENDHESFYEYFRVTPETPFPDSRPPLQPHSKRFLSPLRSCNWGLQFSTVLEIVELPLLGILVTLTIFPCREVVIDLKQNGVHMTEVPRETNTTIA